MQIAEYQKDYAASVIELILNIQRNEFNMSITKEEQPDLGAIEKFYRLGNGNFFVALNDAELIGTIGLLDLGNQQGALRKMFVKKEIPGKEYNTARLLLGRYLNERGGKISRKYIWEQLRIL